jgi:Zn-finger nucleic acid-binding protein
LLYAIQSLEWIEQKKGESPYMECPKCRTPTLEQFSVQEVAVERCSSCSGIWFDAQELSQLLEEDARHVASLRRGSVVEQLEGKKGLCPRDGSDLLRVYSSIDRSVILDACAECRGIWLDGGEFDKLFTSRQQ